MAEGVKRRVFRLYKAVDGNKHRTACAERNITLPFGYGICSDSGGGIIACSCNNGTAQPELIGITDYLKAFKNQR